MHAAGDDAEAGLGQGDPGGLPQVLGVAFNVPAEHCLFMLMLQPIRGHVLSETDLLFQIGLAPMEQVVGNPIADERHELAHGLRMWCTLGGALVETDRKTTAKKISIALTRRQRMSHSSLILLGLWNSECANSECEKDVPKMVRRCVD
jgi:hypothetical protein